MRLRMLGTASRGVKPVHDNAVDMMRSALTAATLLFLFSTGVDGQRAACPDSARVLLHGVVRDSSTSVALRGARVLVSWLTPDSLRRQRIETHSVGSGLYHV